MVTKIAEGVYKASADSNSYLVDVGNGWVVIDTGRKANQALVEAFSEIVPLDEIKTVVFTHLHYDHIGNFDLFPNATFYAAKEEIEGWQEDKFNAILDQQMANLFDVELHVLKELPPFEIIKTPGHTEGSISLYHPEKKILFSGDTLFFNNGVGRTDFPTSVPDEMQSSLHILLNLDFAILCPGHDY